MAEIKHGHNKFYVGDSEENPDAEMTYVPTGKDKIIIDHTGVGESLRGQGIAKQLVEAGVNYARENDIKILVMVKLYHIFLIDLKQVEGNIVLLLCLGE